MVTETEKKLRILRHARDYTESFANGRNPLNGGQLSHEDCATNPKLQRYFAYMVTVLDEVITFTENPPLLDAKNRTKPFDLSEAQLKNGPISSVPVNVSTIAREYNALVEDPYMKRITPTLLAEWLKEKGFLEETAMDGRKNKIPTDAGRSIGISCSEAVSRNHERYMAVAYDTNAQQYIRNHFSEFMEWLKNRS